jgi:hypothetical protein
MALSLTVPAPKQRTKRMTRLNQLSSTGHPAFQENRYDVAHVRMKLFAICARVLSTVLVLLWPGVFFFSIFLFDAPRHGIAAIARFLVVLALWAYPLGYLVAANFESRLTLKVLIRCRNRRRGTRPGSVLQQPFYTQQQKSASPQRCHPRADLQPFADLLVLFTLTHEVVSANSYRVGQTDLLQQVVAKLEVTGRTDVSRVRQVDAENIFHFCRTEA